MIMLAVNFMDHEIRAVDQVSILDSTEPEYYFDYLERFLAPL